ncbi:MAG: response regulator [Deltaproteobacteria bacterium]|jgi:signal transduction histidine kinase/HPt (histidine-containing phosphotransfer) domain-containing protein/FixJ family two-component response regulator|nr:response regulator [Deltaproteobacteria bacterium]
MTLFSSHMATTEADILTRAAAENSAPPGARIKRTFLWFSVLILISASVAAVLAYALSSRLTNLQYAERQLSVASETLKLRLNTVIDGELILTRKLADNDHVRDYFLNPNDKVLKEKAIEEITNYQFYLKKGYIFWSNLQDRIVYSTIDPYYYSYPNDSTNYWYDYTINHAEPYYINTSLNIFNMKNTVWINVAVFTDNETPRRALGLVGSAIAVPLLSDEIAASYKKLDNNLVYYIYDSGYEIIASNKDDLISKKISILDYIPSIKDKLIELRENNLPSRTIVTHTDVYLASYVPVFNWTVVTNYPLPAFISINKSFNIMFFGTLTIFILIILASNIFITRSDNILASQNLRLIEANRQAELASTAKTNFLAHISHEIRTPLNAIIGMSELILREDTSLRVNENAANVRQAGTSLLAMINDLLDLSKLEAGKMELNPQEYWLGSLIRDVVSIIRLRLDDTGLKFYLNVDPALPTRLVGDEIGLRQILLNLLSNAVKYTEQGSVTLTVGQKADACDNKNKSQKIDLNQPDMTSTIELFFEVSDTGIGIRQDDLKIIFESYQRFDRILNRDVEGTGLGLTITKKLLDAMNGKITVDSVYGQGSVFSVTIPQRVFDPSPIGEFTFGNDNQRGMIAHFTAPEARILLVDDVATNLKIGKGLLAPYEASIDLCDDGLEAINLVEKTYYDLIFMDLMMPGLDGQETARLIRAKKGEYYQKVPIIALSADSSCVATDGDSVFTDRLAKPVDLTKLDVIMEIYIPAEKRQRPGSQEGKAASALPPLNIPGLDTNIGLTRSGGNVAMYLDVLGWFCRDSEACLAELNKPFDLSKDSPLSHYARQFHALKSAAGGVGATTIATEAMVLEEASWRGDSDKVLSQLDNFKQDLSALISSLNSKLAQIADEMAPTKLIQLDPAMLQELKKALETEDIQKADDILGSVNILSCDAPTGQMLSEVLDQILRSEFAQAAEILNRYLANGLS